MTKSHKLVKNLRKNVNSNEKKSQYSENETKI